MSTGAPRLIADIGGTHARFALVRAGGDVPEAERTLRCADYPGFVEAAQAYLDSVDGPHPHIGLCAIANPVVGDRLHMTNHDWSFSIEAARQRLDLTRLRFINDFAAQALAIPHLSPAQMIRFGGADPRPGYPLAVLGPGTGLGVSGLIPSPQGWIPVEGEGGHVAFSPMTERESAVAAVIRRKTGHCSAERIASGIGLVGVYRALCELDGVQPEPLPPDAITARMGDCARCAETVQIFSLGLATTAANLAITLGAHGGVYLCGGILPRLGRRFDTSAFRRRFEDKGRFRDYLAAIPSYLVHARDPALLGLARTLGAVHE